MLPLEDVTYEGEILIGTKYILIKAYHGQEKMMNRVRAKCSHLNHKTMSKFVSNMQSLVKQQKKCKSTTGWNNIDTKIHAESGRGVCQFCSKYFASNLYKFIKWNNLKINCNKRYLHKITREEIFMLENYFWNCLMYPSIAIFIFKQTNLFMPLFDIVDLSLNILFKKYKKVLNWQKTRTCHCELVYTPLLCILEQLIRNIKLFEDKHWEYIMRDRDGFGSSYFKHWLDYILFEANNQLYIDFVCADRFILSFMMLINRGLHSKSMDKRWGKIGLEN